MNYTIKRGDTLNSVARAQGLTMAALLDLNPRYKANPNVIRVGDELRLSMPTPVSARSAPPIVSGQPRRPSQGDAQLGRLSEKYETGGRGPGTVSTGAGDAGGVSYGAYQMTSRGGGTVGRFVSQPGFPWFAEFTGLVPGTEAFSRRWRAIAKAQSVEFQQAQHAYIKKTHYDPLVAKILRGTRLDINTRSFALRDVIWSTAVQHGPGTLVVNRAVNDLRGRGTLNVTDRKFDRRLIQAVYAERGKKNARGDLVYFLRNTRTVQQGVARRFIEERQDALSMLDDE